MDPAGESARFPIERGGLHFDVGGGFGWGHFDHGHYDNPHGDQQHLDIPHGDLHGDEPVHSDVGHSDAEHSDGHWDDPKHYDEPHDDHGHDDAHHDQFADVHGDQHGDENPHNDYHYDLHYDHADEPHSDVHSDEHSDGVAVLWERLEGFIDRLERRYVLRDQRVAEILDERLGLIAAETDRVVREIDHRLVRIERTLEVRPLPFDEPTTENDA